MPNRILKESICVSDSIDELSWFEEVLFYRLIVNCDDFGRFDGRPKVIRGRLFPLKSITDKQISEALHHLAAAGIVMLYSCDGKPFLQLVTWDAHQQIRASKSKYPAPSDGVKLVGCNQLISSDINCNQMISDDSKCSRNPIQSKSKSESNTKTNTVRENFEKLWALYPNKKGKGQVSKSQQEKLSQIPFEEMERAISRYKKGLEKDEWRKPQNGSTFFNSGYVDYLDANYQESVPEKSVGKYDFAALEKSALGKVMGGAP